MDEPTRSALDILGADIQAMSGQILATQFLLASALRTLFDSGSASRAEIDIMFDRSRVMAGVLRQSADPGLRKQGEAAAETLDRLIASLQPL